MIDVWVDVSLVPTPPLLYSTLFSSLLLFWSLVYNEIEVKMMSCVVCCDDNQRKVIGPIPLYCLSISPHYSNPDLFLTVLLSFNAISSFKY